MTAAGDVVFLLDVDNTLLDNDRMHDELAGYLERECGAAGSERVVFDGVDVVPEVHAVLGRMADFSNRVRSRSSGADIPGNPSAMWSASASAARISDR